jgi:hypothetical protein
VPTVKYGGARQLTFPLKTCCAVKHRRCGEGVEPILSEACSQGYPESAICVQKLDDSLNSAIRITYRISLRSSSVREPRYPLLRVVQRFVKVSRVEKQKHPKWFLFLSCVFCLVLGYRKRFVLGWVLLLN